MKWLWGAQMWPGNCVAYIKPLEQSRGGLNYTIDISPYPDAYLWLWELTTLPAGPCTEFLLTSTQWLQAEAGVPTACHSDTAEVLLWPVVQLQGLEGQPDRRGGGWRWWSLWWNHHSDVRGETMLIILIACMLFESLSQINVCPVTSVYC